MNGRYWFVISVLLLILAGSWATVNLGDDIVPIINDLFNIGSPSERINTVYVNTTDTNNAIVRGVLSGDGNMDGGLLVSSLWQQAGTNTELRTPTDIDVKGKQLLNTSVTDFNVYNSGQDKDILVKINDGGTTRTAIQINGDEGSVTMPRQSYVLAYIPNTQTIGNSSNTTVIFDSEITDTLGEYNNATGVFTAKDAGVYSVSANVMWANANNGSLYQTFILYAGGNVAARALNSVAAVSAYLSQTVSAQVKLAAGENIYINVWQNSGGNETIGITADPACQLSITKVS